MIYLHKRTAIPIRHDNGDAIAKAIPKLKEKGTALEKLTTAYNTFKANLSPKISSDEKKELKRKFIIKICTLLKIDNTGVLTAFNANGQDFTKTGWTSKSAISIMAALYTEVLQKPSIQLGVQPVIIEKKSAIDNSAIDSEWKPAYSILNDSTIPHDSTFQGYGLIQGSENIPEIETSINALIFENPALILNRIAVSFGFERIGGLTDAALENSDYREQLVSDLATKIFESRPQAPAAVAEAGAGAGPGPDDHSDSSSSLVCVEYHESQPSVREAGNVDLRLPVSISESPSMAHSLPVALPWDTTASNLPESVLSLIGKAFVAVYVEGKSPPLSVDMQAIQKDVETYLKSNSRPVSETEIWPRVLDKSVKKGVESFRVAAKRKTLDKSFSILFVMLKQIEQNNPDDLNVRSWREGVAVLGARSGEPAALPAVADLVDPSSLNSVNAHESQPSSLGDGEYVRKAPKKRSIAPVNQSVSLLPAEVEVATKKVPSPTQLRIRSILSNDSSVKPDVLFQQIKSDNYDYPDEQFEREYSEELQLLQQNQRK